MDGAQPGFGKPDRMKEPNPEGGGSRVGVGGGRGAWLSALYPTVCTLTQS